MAVSGMAGAAAVGGLLMGLSSGAKTLVCGRVLGCAGGIRGLASVRGVRFAAFVAGAIAASFTAAAAAPRSARAYAGLDSPAMAGAGMLVAIGTTAANGCTSGHGITGVSRLSRRSLVSTAIFFLTAVMTATLGHFRAAAVLPPDYDTVPVPAALAVAAGEVVALAAVVALRRAALLPPELAQVSAEFVLGFGFNVGLITSAMSRPAMTLMFLDLRSHDWSFNLAIVLVAALAANCAIYYGLVRQRKTSLLGNQISLPPTWKREDSKLVLGSLIFGLGWGISGMCPGPAVASIAFERPGANIAFLVGMLATYILYGLYERFESRLEPFLAERSTKVTAAQSPPSASALRTNASAPAAEAPTGPPTPVVVEESSGHQPRQPVQTLGEVKVALA